MLDVEREGDVEAVVLVPHLDGPGRGSVGGEVGAEGEIGSCSSQDRVDGAPPHSECCQHDGSRSEVNQLHPCRTK